MRLIKNKKGLTFKNDWVEIFSIYLILLGLIISLIIDSAIVAYIIILTCGFIIGKYYLTKKILRNFTFFLLVLGFYIGFILGVYFLNNRGSIIFITISFLIGIF
ncbi:MAG: hypothetical protein ACLFPJ_04365, partial [Candidatus Woesearchaeota archaeon]